MGKLLSVACLVAASALFPPRSAHSQDPSRDLPAHAHYTTTEQGWTCNEGFKQLAGFCVEDNADVPSQGPFEVYNGQWRCRSGYQRSGTFCVTPTAPAHATMVEPGGRWECDWGYKKVASRCEEISPPEHAYLDASGHEWVCYPGYERNSDHCARSTAGVPVEPASAPTATAQPKSDAGSQGDEPR
jgi:hypothetical protein